MRAWLALAVLFTGAARGQAPSYSAAGIVNASNYAPGPFAPNSALSLFGSNLSYSTQALTGDQLIGGKLLPTQMAGVAVYIDFSLTPLLYVSPTQINFLLPITEIAGPAQVTVVREGVNGPNVTINLLAAAPQLFTYQSGYPGYAIAQDWNAASAVITPDAPAHAGDVVILYATGLGAVAPSTASGELAEYPSPITNSIAVTLNGVALAPSAILYAGLSPGSAGLYQINILLPANVGTDPALQVSMGGQPSAAGCKLAVR